MKNKKAFIFLIFSLILFFQTFSYSFPKRIVSTMPSITETLFALGLGDRVVGVSTKCDYPKEALKKEKIGDMSINLEKLVSLKPDMIIMVEDSQQYDIWKLKKRGFPVYTINPKNVEEVFSSIEYIASITGVTYEGRALVSRLKWRLYLAQSKNAKKLPDSLFVMVGYRPLVSSGRGTFVNDIIEKSGFKNAIEKKGNYPQLSFEELYRLNPEYILVPEGLVSEKDIRQDLKLLKLKAFEDGRIIWIDPDIIFRPGPRVVEAIERISSYIK